MKKISVIVPVYNAEKYIERCIKSILDQTYENLEILLIDDGSLDKCPEICDEWARKDERIEVIHKDNEGVSIARNIGIDRARGEYIAFVDSDDYLDSEIFGKLITSIEKNNSDIAICNFYPNKEIQLKEQLTREEVYSLLLDRKMFRGYMWNKLYKTSIIKNNKIKFEDNIYMCEDLLFNCVYLKYCFNASYVNERLYYYNDDSISAINCKLNSKFLTVFDAYQKIEKIYINNKNNLNEFYISYFKVVTDVIYRNNKANEICSKSKLYEKKNALYRLIDKSVLTKKKKIELFVYKNYPMLVGYVRRKIKRKRK
jgi:glycosyltransferase involved in cell wall biosynthesis